MNQPAHILISGRDSDLLSVRGLVLQSAGYRVSTTLEPISRSSDLDSVQLLVLCHTLDTAERQRDLSTLASVFPRAVALCLTPHAGPPEMGVASLDSYAGPRKMLQVVNRLLTS